MMEECRYAAAGAGCRCERNRGENPVRRRLLRENGGGAVWRQHPGGPPEQRPGATGGAIQVRPRRAAEGSPPASAAARAGAAGSAARCTPIPRPGRHLSGYRHPALILVPRRAPRVLPWHSSVPRNFPSPAALRGVGDPLLLLLGCRPLCRGRPGIGGPFRPHIHQVVRSRIANRHRCLGPSLQPTPLLPMTAQVPSADPAAEYVKSNRWQSQRLGGEGAWRRCFQYVQLSKSAGARRVGPVRELLSGLKAVSPAGYGCGELALQQAYGTASTNVN